MVLYKNYNTFLVVIFLLIARPAVGQPGIAARQYSAVAEDDYHYIYRHVHQRLQQHKPRKAQIDGFRLRDDPGSGAFSWQITSPIK